MPTGICPIRFISCPIRSMINAFSLPGGPVYVGEGMLDLMTSEDELAAVLAHEIEHIDHYHCAERVQIEARLRNLKLGIVGAIVQIPLQVWEAGYNKDEELEADREGMRLAVLGGYSPYGAVSYVREIQQTAQRICHSRARVRRKNSPNSPFKACRDISAPIPCPPNASRKPRP